MKLLWITLGSLHLSSSAGAQESEISWQDMKMDSAVAFRDKLDGLLFLYDKYVDLFFTKTKEEAKSSKISAKNKADVLFTRVLKPKDKWSPIHIRFLNSNKIINQALNFGDIDELRFHLQELKRKTAPYKRKIPRNDKEKMSVIRTDVDNPTEPFAYFRQTVNIEKPLGLKACCANQNRLYKNSEFKATPDKIGSVLFELPYLLTKCTLKSSDDLKAFRQGLSRLIEASQRFCGSMMKDEQTPPAVRKTGMTHLLFKRKYERLMDQGGNKKTFSDRSKVLLGKIHKQASARIKDLHAVKQHIENFGLYAGVDFFLYREYKRLRPEEVEPSHEDRETQFGNDLDQQQQFKVQQYKEDNHLRNQNISTQNLYKESDSDSKNRRIHRRRSAAF